MGHSWTSETSPRQKETFGRCRYSLRFTNADVEAAFLKTRHGAMCLNFSRISFLCILVILQMVTERLMLWMDQEDEAVRSALMTDMASLGGMLVICAFWAIVPRLERFSQAVKFQFLEAGAMGVMLTLLVRWVSMQVLMMVAVPATGSELDKETRRYMLCVLALLLDTIVTTTHLALPVRWFLMFFVDTFFVCSFTIFSLLYEGLGPLDWDYTVMAAFPVLVCGANLGLRTLEMKERDLFVTIVDERTLRVQAEFNRECASLPSERSATVSRHDSRKDQDNATASAVPTDTETASLFGAGKGDAEDFDLDRLKALGKQEHWLIRDSDLIIMEEKVLGTGGQGVVLDGFYCRSPAAIKCWPVQAESEESESPAKQRNRMMKAALAELRVLRHIRHPNIVLFHGACLSPKHNNLLLVLEKVAGVLLPEFIMSIDAWKPSSPSWRQQLCVSHMLAEALIYLSSRTPCIVHGDLKPKNVMVEDRGHSQLPKLLDFGLARKVTKRATLRGGTARYVAPEILIEGYRPKPASDVFSLGRLLFFIASGRRPLAACSDKRILATMGEGVVPHLTWTPTTLLLQALRPTIMACTEFKDSERPSVAEVHDILALLVRHGVQPAGKDTPRKQRGPTEERPESSKDSFPSNVGSNDKQVRFHTFVGRMCSDSSDGSDKGLIELHPTTSGETNNTSLDEGPSGAIRRKDSAETTLHSL